MKRIIRFFLSEKRVQERMIGLMDGTVRYRDVRIMLMWPIVKYRFDKVGLPIH